jgi:protein-S-isoprenylcysteine O-methyltransferase Ste14
MRGLELKIPPPAVAVSIAAMMWGVAQIAPSLEVPYLIRMVSAVALALIAFAIDIAGLLSFRRARTTVNPMKPETSSSLVTAGIYTMTRNPMYLGLACMLIAWAVYLSNVWTLCGPAGFVLYINRFQIEPEERALAAKFGATYAAYQSAVRRWL